MEKVKLTREQAEAIKEYIGVYSQSCLVNRHEGKWMSKELKSLNYLSTDEIARALYIGYEVEPEFNVGDWVVFNNKNVFIVHGKQVTGNYNLRSIYDSSSFIDTISPSDLRHATPEEIAEEKERRFFSRNGREPWELAGGDILKADDGGYLVTVKDILPGGHPLFKGGKVYTDLENVKRDFRVACFSHDRKDVDNE